MNYQIAFLALLLANLFNQHRLNAQYSVGYGYGLNPYAQQLSPQNNHIVYNIANSEVANDEYERSPYSKHRLMALSLWSGTPIVVGEGYGNGNSHSSGKQHQEYNERSSDRLTPAYLPTNFYNSFLDTQSRGDNIESHQQQPLHEEEDDVRRKQQVVYTTRAANHNYDNVANKLYENHKSDNNEDDNYYYNRHQLKRGSSRRNSVHGQPEIFATVSTTVQSGLLMTPRQLGYNFGRVGAGSYYEPPLPLQLQSEQRANSANYAKHFANYLRKYPQRLQPIYDSKN